MRTIVHLSDIHFGRVDNATVEPLAAKVREIAPDLTVISGDLTQRARAGQFREARAFLDRLPHPLLVIPGNHDVPFYNFAARFLMPLRNYKRFITRDLEPWFADEEIAVIGIDTARSLVFKGGRINEEQIDAIRRKLCPLGDDVIKIVVTHHPFDLPREFGDENLVGRAALAMKTIASCGVDVLMAGHFHISHTGDTSTRYPIPGFSALVVQAGTATSTRGRGEANSFNILRIERPRIVVDRVSWDPARGTFDLDKTEPFIRTPDGWRREATPDAEDVAEAKETAKIGE
jgi:3',5'-cyclic AMP phosphodiesterase CpdA